MSPLATAAAPRWYAFRKGDTGRVLIVDIDSELRVVQHVVGRRSFDELALRAEAVDSEARLKAAVEALADLDTVMKLSIRGVRGISYPDVEGVVDELRGLFFHILLYDRSTASPESVDPASYPQGSPAAVYLGLLARTLEAAGEAEREELTEAMRIGAAMLAGSAGT